MENVTELKVCLWAFVCPSTLQQVLSYSLFMPNTPESQLWGLFLYYVNISKSEHMFGVLCYPGCWVSAISLISILFLCPIIAANIATNCHHSCRCDRLHSDLVIVMIMRSCLQSIIRLAFIRASGLHRLALIVAAWQRDSQNRAIDMECLHASTKLPHLINLTISLIFLKIF